MYSIITILYLLILDITHIIYLIILQPINALLSLLNNKSSSINLRKYYEGKVVMITGASSGIGRELSLQLSMLGSSIILCSRDEKKLNDVALECHQVSLSKSQKFIVLPVDMSNYNKMEEYWKTCQNTLENNSLPSNIDVLILNAGISSRGACNETNVDVIEKLMAVNFFGPVALTKCILPSMEEKGSGAIAVISSVQGKLGLPQRTSYAASKHALQGFYDGLRAEVALKNIRLTTISPGYVKTNLSLNAINGDGSNYGKLDETTANGMSPSVLSKIILKSINENKKDVVVADSKSIAAIQLNVMFPDIAAWIMRKRAKKG